MRLIIVRHGETEANLERVLQGHRGNSLSERGREQAANLARRLAEEKIDLIYTSDLRRAAETADYISSETGVAALRSPLLRERCYGEFEGRSIDEYESALAASGLTREAFMPQKGESLRDLESRVSEFLYSVLRTAKGKTVLLIAHTGTNRALLKVLLRMNFEECLTIAQDNTCVNILTVAEDSVNPLVLNCTAHLESCGFAALGVCE